MILQAGSRDEWIIGLNGQRSCVVTESIHSPGFHLSQRVFRVTLLQLSRWNPTLHRHPVAVPQVAVGNLPHEFSPGCYRSWPVPDTLAGFGRYGENTRTPIGPSVDGKTPATAVFRLQRRYRMPKTTAPHGCSSLQNPEYRVDGRQRFWEIVTSCISLTVRADFPG